MDGQRRPSLSADPGHRRESHAGDPAHHLQHSRHGITPGKCRNGSRSVFEVIHVYTTSRQVDFTRLGENDANGKSRPRGLGVGAVLHRIRYGFDKSTSVRQPTDGSGENPTL